MNPMMMSVPIPMAGKRHVKRARAAVAWSDTAVRCGFGAVPLRSLRATQDEVYAPRVDELRENPAGTGACIPIVVARMAGVFVIVDGHHRATAHYLSGSKKATICAFIVEAFGLPGDGAKPGTKGSVGIECKHGYDACPKCDAPNVPAHSSCPAPEGGKSQ